MAFHRILFSSACTIKLEYSRMRPEQCMRNMRVVLDPPGLNRKHFDLTNVSPYVQWALHFKTTVSAKSIEYGLKIERPLY